MPHETNTISSFQCPILVCRPSNTMRAGVTCVCAAVGWKVIARVAQAAYWSDSHALSTRVLFPPPFSFFSVRSLYECLEYKNGDIGVKTIEKS